MSLTTEKKRIYIWLCSQQLVSTNNDAPTHNSIVV